MKVSIRADSVVVEGYVNAIERNSKPLMSRIGRFIERVCKGAFTKAIKRNDDIHILLNHDWNKDLGSTKQGNLELTEDAIGLHARAEITDKDVIEKAKNGELVGWSFGFTDREGGVKNLVENGMPVRAIEDLDLYEVSLLDKSKQPAYDGTLVTARSVEDNIEYHYRSEALIDDVVIEVREEQPKQHENVDKDIDYSKYERMIQEMKEDFKNEWKRT